MRFLLLTACFFALATFAPAQDERAVVIRVLAGGMPAAGAKVWVYVPSEKHAEPADLIADAEGKAIAKLTAPGQRFAHAFARDGQGRLGQIDLRLNLFGTQPEVDLELLDTEKRTGRVTDAKGQPIVGADIVPTHFSRLNDANGVDERKPRFISLPEWEAPRQTTRTDKEGRFVVAGVPRGYGLSFAVKAERFGETRFRTTDDSPAEVKLTPAGTVVVRFSGLVDIEKLKGVSLRIDPKDQAKQPTAGVQAVRWHNAELDGQAEFVIPNVLPGRYGIKIRPNLKVPAMPATAQDFEVASGGNTVVTVPFTPAARVAGKVTDQATGKGLAGVKMNLATRELSDSYALYFGEVETDATGKYMAYAPASWMSVGVSKSPAGFVPPVDRHGSSMTEPVQVAGGKSHTFPDFALLRAVDLAGRVVFADGKAAGKAVVNSSLIGSFDESVIADSQGRFVLKDLRPDDVVEPRIRLGNAVNLPVEFDPAEHNAPVKIEISDKHAVRFHGQVTDQKGAPVASAKVVIEHRLQGVGRNSTTGMGRYISEVRTGMDGRFESPGLWAKDYYLFKIRVDGYADAESKRQRGDPGAVVEVPTIVLSRSALIVAGIVVGLDGKPVAGVTVFGVDGPSRVSTVTKADGRFTLKGYYDAPGLVFAKKEGHRLTALPVTPGGKPVVITMRSPADPPAPAPQISAKHAAAEKELIRRLLTARWNIRGKYGYERNTLDCMTRFDLDTAKAWRDEEKKRTEGKADFTDLIDKENRHKTLFDLARKDVDEALEVFRSAKEQDVFREVLDLGQRLAAVDPAKAERLAEEAVVQARQMKLPHKAWSLAQAGELAIRAGNAAGGTKVIAEAADWADKLGNEGLDGLARGMVAARLAPIDWPRAKKLLDSFKEPNDYNRYLQNAAVQLASTDLAKAKKLLGEFRPSNTHYPHTARLLIAFHIARDHPDEAVALVEGTTEAVYRVKGLMQLAGHFVATDRKRALAMIDQAFDEMEKDEEPFRGWSGSGGRAGLAALAVHRAQELGHPDIATLVARTLAFRPTAIFAGGAKDRQNALVRIALMLALTDPAAARQVLAGVASPDQFVKRAVSEGRDWLFALALADPSRAIALMDRHLAALEKSQGGASALSHTGLVELGSILTARNRLRALALYGSGFSEVTEED